MVMEGSRLNVRGGGDLGVYECSDVFVAGCNVYNFMQEYVEHYGIHYVYMIRPYLIKYYNHTSRSIVRQVKRRYVYFIIK